MVKKRASQKTVRSGKGKVNKAAMLRDLLRKNPNLMFGDAVTKFKDMNLSLTSAQFYSIRAELQKKEPTSRKKTTTKRKSRRQIITPAKPPVSVSAKSAPCTADLNTSSEIYGDPALTQAASTQPPDVPRTLQARNIIEQAYREAWQLVGQNYALVDVIVDDVQEKHRTS